MTSARSDRATFALSALRRGTAFPLSGAAVVPPAPRLRYSNPSEAGGLVANLADRFRYFFYSCRRTAVAAGRCNVRCRFNRRLRPVVLAVTFALAGLTALPASADRCRGNVFNEAAAQYHLDPDLLRAITWVESRGAPGAVGPKLADGHRAWGAAQINDVHLAELASYGVTRQDLLDPCVNLKLGAWVLASCIRAKGATWAAVGCYNAGPASTNTAAQARYVRLVQHAYAGYRAQSAADANFSGAAR